jgi:RNA polymerase sigma-70 factor (ECF subfamily)
MNANFENISDEELIKLFKEKSNASIQAFETLYSRYSPSLYLYFYKFLKDSFFIKDLYQDLFLKIYELGVEGKLDNIDNFKGYLYRMAHNLALNKLKNDEKQRNYIDSYKDSSEEIDSISESNREDTIKNLQDALEQLPPQLKEILILREYNHLSYLEIAKITDETMENVKIRIFRAKKKLKQIMTNKSKKIRKMV